MNRLQCLAIMALLAFALLAMAGRSPAQDLIGLGLPPCDSSLIMDYVNSVFHDRCREYWIRDAERPCSIRVYLGDSIPCLKRWPPPCAIVASSSGTDSVAILFYATCDTMLDRVSACSAIPPGSRDFRAALINGTSPRSAPEAVLDLDSLVFPEGCHQSGHNMPQVISVEWLTPPGDGGSLLTMHIGDDSFGNHPHSDGRQGFWWWEDDSLLWLGSLWRSFSSVVGAASVYAFESDLERSDELSQDIVHFNYTRHFERAVEAWSGSLSDRLPVLVAISPSGIQIEGLLNAEGGITPIRNSLPILVGGQLGGDPDNPATPPSVVAVPTLAQTTFMEPTLGILPSSVWSDLKFGGSSGHHAAESIQMWVDKDSLVIAFVCTNEEKAAFWFDTDLEGDFDDQRLSSDDRVYVVRQTGLEERFLIEGFCLDRDETGNARFLPCDTAVAYRRWYPNELAMIVRIACREIGFMSPDSIALCGIGFETVPRDAEFPETDAPSVQMAPGAFERANPMTWMTMVLGQRADYIDQRRLQRR